MLAINGSGQNIGLRRNRIIWSWSLRIEAHAGVIANRAGWAPGVGHGGSSTDKRTNAGDGNRQALCAVEGVGQVGAFKTEQGSE